MNREDAYNRIDAIIAKHEIDDEYVTITSALDYDALRFARKLLEQEPCEDWYDVHSNEMTVEQARQAVKDLRKKLAEHLEQEPCEDAISRQAVSEAISRIGLCKCNTNEIDAVDECLRAVKYLPPVQPQPKTGHWIKDDITERSKSAYKHKCDRCGAYHRAMYDYCPSCGIKMVEPQERSGEE